MLKLALLRHAKSSWDEPSLDDFDRPLNARGRQAAPVMGRMLAALKFSPDVVLCSPSKRTRETLAAIAPFFATPGPRVIFNDALYLASPSDLMSCISSAGITAARVLLIGHNPGLQTLAAQLAATGDAGQIARMTDKFPTAALAVFRFDDTSFAGISADRGHLDAFITPKDRA